MKDQSKAMTLNFDGETVKRLERLCVLQGCSKSELVAMAIQQLSEQMPSPAVAVGEVDTNEQAELTVSDDGE
jgi:predicted transcriptional regulator